MKGKLVVIICAMLSFCIIACASKSKKTENNPICAEWMKPDTAAYNKLGKRLAEILFAPQKVKCYRLVGKENVAANDVEIEKNFVRDTLLTTLKKEEVAVLQYSLLKAGRNYSRDSIIVMSPYMPILEFEFQKKKERAYVVVSLSDMSWAVFFDDKKQFHYNYGNEELIAQFCNYYLSLSKKH